MKSTSYKLKASVFDRQRTLTLLPEYVEYESSDTIGNAFTRFYTQDIVDVKYGEKEILLSIHIPLGKVYYISFRDKNNNILNIKFSTVFNFNTDHDYAHSYSQMVLQIREYYLNNIIQRYQQRFDAGEKLILGKTEIDQQGIKLTGTGLNIPWKKLHIKEYIQLFIISNKTAPEYHLNIYYNDWNAQVLYSLILSKLKPN